MSRKIMVGGEEKGDWFDAVLSWASPEKDEAARAEGKCCGNWKHLPNWSVRGLHTPVPVSHRRSPEKEGGMGWPGLCCDPKTGLYIGGVGNDCRYYHNGPERCIIHAVTVSKYTKTAAAALPADETDEPDSNDEPDFIGTMTEDRERRGQEGTPTRVTSRSRKRNT